MTLVRFAPSPTGLIHVGNARTALVNYLFALKHKGEFMLRIDDTDTERSTKEFEDKIIRDFQWLGFEWTKFDRQSQRTDRYMWGFEELKKLGRLYPCYETPEELNLKRKVQLSRGLPPIYDRAALNLTDNQKQTFEAQGRKPHWRFKMNHTPISWNDLGRGEIHFEGEKISDPVLFREDMKPIYMLASTIDDMDHDITHVIRGVDHITNTAIMIQICEALKATPPVFAHISRIVDAEGEGISKRKGGHLSLESLREEGMEPMALSSYLSRLGTSDAIEPVLSLKELAEDFDMAKFSRATPKFNLDDLKALNAKLIHIMPFDSVRDRLPGMEAEAWGVVRENITTLRDVGDWIQVIRGPIHPVVEEPEFLDIASSVLPPTPWTTDTWGQWTNTLKEKTGRKGKALFMPLRKALTGMEHGPEMPKLLPLISPEKAQKRLKGIAA